MLRASFMVRLSSTFAAVALCAASAAAQLQHPVGMFDLVWPNPTTAGSAQLFARIYYPALTAGFGTTPVATTNGWPTVVFLHGYGQFGNDYDQLASAWTTNGFAVVALDTAQFDFVQLRDDAIAVHSAIQIANGTVGTLTHGLYDTGRMMLAGHSMGGGVTAMVLASNPGYRGGFAIAPFDPTSVVGPVAASVDQPFGILVGDGDPITPPLFHAQPLFQTLGVSSLKFLYWMDATCDHLDVAGLQTNATDPAFESSVQVGLGFFAHVLDTSPEGLENCIGPAALSDPQLLSMQQQFGIPQVWSTRPLQLGTTTRYSVGVEPGLGAVVVSSGMIPSVPTPFGDLLVDPTTAFFAAFAIIGVERRLDLPVTVPFDPQLVGASLAMQAFGTCVTAPMRLGSALSVVVVP